MRNSRLCNYDFIAGEINPLLDHGLLLGLADDDHLQYLPVDGSRSPTADIDWDNYGITTLHYVDWSLENGLPPAEGRMIWNDDEGTLNLGMKGGTVNQQMGLELFLPRSRNDESVQINNGQLVYVFSGTGAVPTVKLASASVHSQAKATLAMATEDVSAGQLGYFTSDGLVRDVDTGSYSAGDELFLVENGNYSNTPPTQPDSIVCVGVVIRAHATEGIIHVRLHPHPNLDELSDCLISSIADNDLLAWDSGAGVWKNQTPTEAGFDNLYVRRDGTTPLTGNWDAGNFEIAAGALVIDNITLDGDTISYTDVTGGLRINFDPTGTGVSDFEIAGGAHTFFGVDANSGDVDISSYNADITLNGDIIFGTDAGITLTLDSLGDAYFENDVEITGNVGIGMSPVTNQSLTVLGGSEYGLTIHQGADNRGFRVYGYDDRSAEWVNCFIASSGNAIWGSSKNFDVASGGFVTFGTPNGAYDIIFDGGRTFKWRDRRGSYATRMSLDAATGTLQTYGAVNFTQTDGAERIDSDADGTLDLYAGTSIDLHQATTIGDGGTTDYSEFETDGTYVAHGAATVWEDIQSSLIGRRLASVSGGVAYNYANNTVTFDPNGDETNVNDSVQFNLQLSHKTKADSDFHLHVHFEQPSDSNYEFTARYRIQNNGSLKTTAWTTISGDYTNNGVYTWGTGTLNQIISLPAIDLTGAGLSDVIQIQFARTDSVSGDIEVTFVDAHYEIDTIGSRTEFSK